MTSYPPPNNNALKSSTCGIIYSSKHRISRFHVHRVYISTSIYSIHFRLSRGGKFKCSKSLHSSWRSGQLIWLHAHIISAKPKIIFVTYMLLFITYTINKICYYFFLLQSFLFLTPNACSHGLYFHTLHSHFKKDGLTVCWNRGHFTIFRNFYPDGFHGDCEI